MIAAKRKYICPWPSAQIVLQHVHFPPRGFASQPQLLAEPLAAGLWLLGARRGARGASSGQMARAVLGISREMIYLKLKLSGVCNRPSFPLRFAMSLPVSVLLCRDSALSPCGQAFFCLSSSLAAFCLHLPSGFVINPAGWK